MNNMVQYTVPLSSAFDTYSLLVQDQISDVWVVVRMKDKSESVTKL